MMVDYRINLQRGEEQPRRPAADELDRLCQSDHNILCQSSRQQGPPLARRGSASCLISFDTDALPSRRVDALTEAIETVRKSRSFHFESAPIASDNQGGAAQIRRLSSTGSKSSGQTEREGTGRSKPPTNKEQIDHLLRNLIGMSREELKERSVELGQKQAGRDGRDSPRGTRASPGKQRRPIASTNPPASSPMKSSGIAVTRPIADSGGDILSVGTPETVYANDERSETLKVSPSKTPNYYNTTPSREQSVDCAPRRRSSPTNHGAGTMTTATATTTAGVAKGIAMAAVPPPPPPRREGHSAKPAHHVSPPAANLNATQTADRDGGGPARKPHRIANGGLGASFTSQGSKDAMSNMMDAPAATAPAPRKSSVDHGRSEPILTEPSKNVPGHEVELPLRSSNDGPSKGGSKVNFRSAVSNHSKALVEDEASEFKKFCSLSLTELGSSSHSLDGNDAKFSRMSDFNSSLTDRSVGNSNFNNSNNNMGGLAPRPVRVSQFEDDGEDGPHLNQPSTPRSNKVVTTTSFVNSIRKGPSTDIGTMRGSDGGTTPLDTPGASSNSCRQPHSAKMPSSTGSNHRHPPPPPARPPQSAKGTDELPDTVDKKGRCKRHPNVKLFKKKLLGGYELIRPSCPNCLEEAPYEELWRERAKNRRSASREPGDSRATSRERSGSFTDRSFDASFKSGQRMRSRSRGRRSRSRERGMVSGDQPDNTLPCVPPLQGEGEGEVAARGSGGQKSPYAAPQRPSGQGFKLPPPPLNHQGGRPSPAPPRRRKSFDGKANRGRVRSLSAGRTERREATSLGNSPQHEKLANHNDSVQSKSFFDKGKDKLSSLQSKARRRGSDDWMASCDERTFCTAASDHDARHSPHYTKRSVHASDVGPVISHSSAMKKGASQNKIKFDKKTGRCKRHPSVIIAKKSSFNRGWDIIRDACPYCEGEKGPPAEEADNDFSEISKKKMNALLHGSQSFPLDDNVRANSRPTDKSSRKTAPTQNLVDSVPPQGGGASSRVSRMPYTTPWGETGWYTGEVDQSGKPNGQGRMRYKTGNQTEGEWTNGYSVEFLENRDRMRSGFGTNVAPWKESERQAKEVSRSSGRSGPGQAAMAMSPAKAQYSSHQQGQYAATPAPAAAYHGSQAYGMVPVAMMPSGMWAQSPGGYHQAHWPSASPGGGQANLPHPPYNPGYHQ